MNHRFFNSVKTYALAIVVLFASSAFTSCDDRIEDENRFTFKGELIATHLEGNPEKYSHFVEILTKARIGKELSGNVLKTLSTYGSYTCFAPTNEAVEKFIAEEYEKYNNNEDSGIYSLDISEISDSMATEIAKNHIIERGYKTIDINEGSFPMSTMNRRTTTVEWITDEKGQVFTLLNNNARIIEQDLEMENGYIQTIDAVLNPSNKLLPDQIASHSAFSLFTEAIYKTGLDSLLRIYELDPQYDGTREADAKFDSEPSTSPYPKDKKQKYTVLIEPDKLFHDEEIMNLSDLIEFANKWYGKDFNGAPLNNEVLADYKNPMNPLNRFIAYHIIDRQLQYSSGTGPGGFIMENYDNANFKSNINLNQNFDSYEYYETIHPYSMIKVTKPYTNEKLKSEIVINYAQEKGTTLINPEMEKHINVIVEKASDAKKKYPELNENYNQGALNGIIHTIDRILVYNENEMAGNVLKERIRIDVSALFPELTNNEVRWDLSSGGNLVTYIPEDFCKGFVVNNDNTEVFYYRPHETMLGSWANYQGDEFIVEGKYDFQYRIPYVPVGNYEIRFGYPKGYYRGVCQFYFDNKIAGIPVDLRWNETTTVLIGWEDVSEMSEEEARASDKAMRNRGYMRGPASVTLDATKAHGTMRHSEQALRKIIGTYRLEKRDYWLRFKDVSENSTGKMTQFDQDYLELVPLSVLNDQAKPEDIY